MDYTLLAVNGSLRPGTKEVLQRLKDDGHVLFIWSGIGVRWPEVRQLGLDIYVAGVFEKPIQDYQQTVEEMLQREQVPVSPDFVVDDDPQVVSALGGIVIRPYYNGHPADVEMEHVYQIISEYTATAHSQDPAFRPKGGEPQT